MKVHELLIALSQIPIEYEVVVAGQGRLTLVTRAYAAEPVEGVCVLYVEEPEAPSE